MKRKPKDEIALDKHIERERFKFGLTPREIGFIERAWKAARKGTK